MPSPIIILLEKPWDSISNEALIGTMPSLCSLGYNRICFEMPSDLTQQDILINFDYTLSIKEARFAEITAYLAKKGIHDDILTLEPTELTALLELHVSSLHANNIASMIKDIPSDRKKLQMVKEARQKHMILLGIDFPSEKVGIGDPINNASTSTVQLHQKRAQYFKNSLLALQRKEVGIIFIVGEEHYSNLVNAFAEENYLKELLFLRPYLSKGLDSLLVDYLLPELTNTNDEVSLIEMTITNTYDSVNFTIQVQEKLQIMLDSNSRIEPTSTSRLLSAKSGIKFVPYVRSSGLVDCYYFQDSADNIDEVTQYLSQQGVEGNFTIFQNRNAFCVQAINTEEVATRISKLVTYRRLLESQETRETVLASESEFRYASKPKQEKGSNISLANTLFNFKLKKNREIPKELNEESSEKREFF